MLQLIHTNAAVGTFFFPRKSSVYSPAYQPHVSPFTSTSNSSLDSTRRSQTEKECHSPPKSRFSIQFLPPYPHRFPGCARCHQSVRRVRLVPWHRSCRELDRGNTAVSTGKTDSSILFLHITAFITPCCHSESSYKKKMFLIVEKFSQVLKSI